MEEWQVQVKYPVSAGPKIEQQAASAVAETLQVPFSAGRRLLASAPLVLPRVLSRPVAEALSKTLAELGVSNEAQQTSPGSLRCSVHAECLFQRACKSCNARLCTLCEVSDGGLRCPACSDKDRRKQRFRSVRLAALSVTLVVVGAWAVGQQLSPDTRRSWRQSVAVSVILLTREELPEAQVQAFKKGLSRLEDTLDAEYQRYTGRERGTFRYELAGPLLVPRSPPFPEADANWFERLLYSNQFRSYRADVDKRASDAILGSVVRIYVDVQPSGSQATAFVEGVATKGGKYGLVRASLRDDMIEQTLIAVAHEVLHCLGATDKYDQAGHALEPDGLVEPERNPVYPQAFAEIMVGEVPLGQGQGRLSSGLEEMRLGLKTAQEIAWVAAEPP